VGACPTPPNPKPPIPNPQFLFIVNILMIIKI